MVRIQHDHVMSEFQRTCNKSPYAFLNAHHMWACCSSAAWIVGFRRWAADFHHCLVTQVAPAFGHMLGL